MWFCCVFIEFGYSKLYCYPAVLYFTLIWEITNWELMIWLKWNTTKLCAYLMWYTVYFPPYSTSIIALGFDVSLHSWYMDLTWLIIQSESCIILCASQSLPHQLWEVLMNLWKNIDDIMRTVFKFPLTGWFGCVVSIFNHKIHFTIRTHYL